MSALFIVLVHARGAAMARFQAFNIPWFLHVAVLYCAEAVADAGGGGGRRLGLDRMYQW